MTAPIAWEDFPEPPASRPIWLVTLADLALLLVGFFVLLQANRHLDARAVADGFRARMGAAPLAPEPIAVAAAGMLNFAPASAALPAAPDALVAWAREVARDPRVTLRVTGSVDGSAADVDPATGSAPLLAADRARAVAAALAAAHVAPGRMTIVNADAPARSHRQVVVTLGFAGERNP